MSTHETCEYAPESCDYMIYLSYCSGILRAIFSSYLRGLRPFPRRAVPVNLANTGFTGYY